MSLATVVLSEETYRDKVMGCWYGKNAGGTLGGPLERIWGQDEPFNIDWYPKLQEGGIPNDDLEIQLVWLQALEDRGLDITCRDLAEYWLDCIWYNPDEYGLHKTNLRMGLQPPVSGWFNNYFKHCMGSPIRSEIWACIAPGLPHVAAAYAWHDAVCDHAGGESVYGEMFNATVESAAFVISDRDRLLDIGLAMIPEDCLTARAIRAARQAFAEGLDWLGARRRVMDVAFSRNAQFSPINLGFQTIGWLYGEDFGDALCKAVNCGYDTDCTGATVGAILGIIHGAKGLPRKWLDPLGDSLLISSGIRHIRKPENLADLTDRVVSVGRRLLARYPGMVELGERNDFSGVNGLRLVDRADAQRISSQPYDAVRFETRSVAAFVRYPSGPAIHAGGSTPVVVKLINRQAEGMRLSAWLEVPEGFSVSPGGKVAVELPEEGTAELSFSVAGSEPSRIGTSNHCWLKLSVDGRPQVESLPVTLVGARKWLVMGPYPGATLENELDPEKDSGMITSSHGWTEASWPENELQVEPFFNGKPGILFLRHFIKCPEERSVRIGVPNSGRMKIWVNGVFVKETDHVVPLRPNYGGEGSNYVDVKLKSGWNSILIKLERGENPVEAHFTMAKLPDCAGLWDVLQTRFPWEE